MSTPMSFETIELTADEANAMETVLRRLGETSDLAERCANFLVKTLNIPQEDAAKLTSGISESLLTEIANGRLADGRSVAGYPTSLLAPVSAIIAVAARDAAEKDDQLLQTDSLVNAVRKMSKPLDDLAKTMKEPS